MNFPLHVIANPPATPNPTIQWLDQGVNSGDGQKAKATCAMPANATELYYDMDGVGCNDYGWTGNTTYTDIGVYDSQTVQVRCKAKGPGGESAYSSWRSVSIGDRTAPTNPSAPGVVWNDQGTNSGDAQKVTVSKALTSGATQVEFDCIAGTPAHDRGKSTSTSYTTPGDVQDSQTYKYKCRMWDGSGNYSSWSGEGSCSIGDRTAPSVPNPSIQWLDQGINSGDGQKVKVTCSIPSGAAELYYDMTGSGTDDYGLDDQCQLHR